MPLFLVFCSHKYCASYLALSVSELVSLPGKFYLQKLLLLL